MATLIKIDGTETEVIGTGKVAKNGKRKITLEDAYASIDCDTVELYAINNRKFMIIDGDGKFCSYLNRKATKLWQDRYGKTDTIFGNVLITQGEGWG